MDLGMHEDDLNYHRVSSFIFGELWPDLMTEVLADASHLDTFRAYMVGLRSTDYEICP